MPSVFDAGLLQSFGIIFPFLLVLVLTYAFLSMGILKTHKAAAGLVAIILAIMMLFSPTIVDIINKITPIFVVFFIIIIFCLIGFGIFGVEPEKVLSSDYGGYVGWWIFIIFLLIVIGSITSVISERGGFPGAGATGPIIGENGSIIGEGGPPQQSAFFQTIFNVKVLGMIVLLLISMITIQRLARVD